MTTGGALAGERGTGAHQLGRGRVLCGACAGDIGRGGSVRGTEPRAELVGTHAAELTEPMLGLDLGDVRRLLERLGGRSTAGLRSRRRPVLGGYRLNLRGLMVALGVMLRGRLDRWGLVGLGG